MILLSLDQAKKCGVSIWDVSEKNDDNILIHYELFKAKSKNYNNVIFEICDYVEYIINKYKIDKMLIEGVQKQVNIKTFHDLSKLQGGLLEVAHKNNIKFEVIQSSEWRKILKTNQKKRNELKELSKVFVFNKLGIECNDDVADCIVMALYYFSRCE